jgi:DNA replication and repair protein RecF
MGWRNYTGAKINFSPGINLFLGNNGQGKTNLLEAIFYLVCGQSPRTGKTEELIGWKSNYYFLQGDFCRNMETNRVEMGAARDGRRVTKVNGSPIHKLADLSEIANVVLFMPEDLYLVKGGPERRRRFLDLEISQLSSSYRYAVKKKKKYLRERNALLKTNNQDRILLGVLTEKLAELAGPITEFRSKYIEKLGILARHNHRKLSGSQEELGFKYVCSIEPGSSLESVLQKFNGAKHLEQKYRSTMVGPQRDDFHFIVNGNDLRTFGSQGQQRTAVLALKLAEIELFRAETNDYPVLLLDDVFSELDESRKKMMLEYLTGRVQTFISSAEKLPDQAQVETYWISAGTICKGD